MRAYSKIDAKWKWMPRTNKTLYWIRQCQKLCVYFCLLFTCWNDSISDINGAYSLVVRSQYASFFKTIPKPLRHTWLLREGEKIYECDLLFTIYSNNGLIKTLLCTPLYRKKHVVTYGKEQQRPKHKGSEVVQCLRCEQTLIDFMDDLLTAQKTNAFAQGSTDCIYREQMKFWKPLTEEKWICVVNLVVYMLLG